MKTGEDPKRMTYIRFQGILDRLHKLRRWEPGGTMTKDELLADRLEAAASEKDDF